jgi:hypothetical protein
LGEHQETRCFRVRLRSTEESDDDYVNGDSSKLVEEFVEVERGKGHDNRPKLKAAIEACNATGPNPS